MYKQLREYERNKLLTRREAAEYLGINEGTLAVWASTNRVNLPYVKIGSLARYRIEDLDMFIQENIVANPDVLDS